MTNFQMPLLAVGKMRSKMLQRFNNKRGKKIIASYFKNQSSTATFSNPI
jgi:hypothetical protein